MPICIASKAIWTMPTIGIARHGANQRRTNYRRNGAKSSRRSWDSAARSFNHWLKPGGIVWDPSLPGFGARRQRSKAVSYVLFYRTGEGRQRWYTIGRHGAPWTPESARDEAQRLLGSVANNADPAADKRAARNAQTVSELCDLYLADAEAGRLVTRRRTMKKPSTLATDRGRIERHIKPLLGRRAVASVTREDIETFMHDVGAGKTAGKTKTEPRGLAHVRGGKGTASRTVGLLGAIFIYAVRSDASGQSRSRRSAACGWQTRTSAI